MDGDWVCGFVVLDEAPLQCALVGFIRIESAKWWTRQTETKHGLAMVRGTLYASVIYTLDRPSVCLYLGFRDQRCFNRRIVYLPHMYFKDTHIMYMWNSTGVRQTVLVMRRPKHINLILQDVYGSRLAKTDTYCPINIRFTSPM